MKTIKIGEKEYILEFTFEAAEHKLLVQKFYDILSGAIFFKHAGKDIPETELESAIAMSNGAGELLSEYPDICKMAFHAGLLENNPVSEEEAKNLMRQYMKENKFSYMALYKELAHMMEADGFFEITGLTEMMESMNTLEDQEEPEEKPAPKKRAPKTPQDHKKSTSTK